ncbi:MAG: RNA pseudouridine synthase [Bacteroidales bacterium]|nr:RNA pseudouridine synthase [Bacteroidales bacterium]
MTILYEDNHLLIVNKRISDIVQGDKTGDVSLDRLLKDFIKVRDGKSGEVFLGIPHRLDRPVSGAVIFAKTSKALSRMANMFKEKEIEKIYHAIVETCPQPESGTLEHYLTRNTKQNKSYVHPREVPGSKWARLEYRKLASSDHYHLLEVLLETGRHHQIRAQLAGIGSVIKGDRKYGARRSNKNGGISLHARRVSFIHPVKKETVEVVAPYPKMDIFPVFKVK